MTGVQTCALPISATLLIKGAEGFIVGIISNPKKKKKRVDGRDVVSVILGGLIMVVGYFVYEVFLFGLNIALVEVFLNGLIQFGVGAILALLFILTARKNISESISQVFERIYKTQ